MCSYFSNRYAGFKGLAVCALLLFGSVALAPGQEVKTSKPRYEELPNFGRVNERLYRGGQPAKGGMNKLAALGVNTVINLRDDDQRASTEAEQAKLAGLRYFNVPFKRLGRPTDSQINEVLSLIDAPENGVVFVHCHHGSDRVGTVIAIYRISHDNWTDQEAKREAESFGMKIWQRGMKDYISDYFRAKSLHKNQPKQQPRVRSVLPILRDKAVLSRLIAVALL
ncbi:MAG TPA: sulfur transferase domain-containing protein [Pyrinomonadaceae bacterium]|nr:sulfur transferase domain-containing protein [Pyrinomonadaceae bacterium]